MDKEKEIEKLCRVMAEYCCNKSCDEPCNKKGYCHIKTFAEHLIDNSYGNTADLQVEIKQLKEQIKELHKQIGDTYYDTQMQFEIVIAETRKQAVKEFTEELKELITQFDFMPEYSKRAIFDEINGLIEDQFGEET